MSKIVFLIFPEEGHLYGSFGLAQKLKLKNHHIIYIGYPDSEKLIISKGFDFISFSNAMNQEIESNNSIDKSQDLRFQQHKNKEFMTKLFTPEFDQILQDTTVDLLIIDSFFPYLALYAFQKKIKSILLSITLQERDKRLPPLNTKIIPKQGYYSKLIIRLKWKFYLSNLYVRKSFLRLLGIDVDFTKLLEKLAKESNYPNQKANPCSTLMPGINMPELIICPTGFEFPRTIPPYLRYIEPCIPPKEDIFFPWEKIEPKKKLIFCSFGSQPTEYPLSHRVYQTIIDTIGKRSDLQLVVSVGKKFRIDNFSNPYPNVLLVNWAPYQDLLQEAAIMINHGGLGAIKQCIFYQVPMVVVPFGRDQFGNSARVAFHGIGLVENRKKLTEATLNNLIDNINSNNEYRQRIKAIGEKFQQLERSSPGVRLIERLAEAPFEELHHIFMDDK